METITIQVESSLAQAYQQIEPQRQQQIQALLNIVLAKAIAPKPLLDVMKTASQQAISQGMTPEILEAILADE
ncbi:hypothetical protein AWQ21_03355 [Picosynechococcus sp. PCC 7003]|uniref:hypothetical protein n=1 Tax=Picosynechococcus sp. PCC 7003 TaxID=374981 RepID=UPI000810874E|nr:hypothetical protein [Picosynechococcus sp. PCC 7003]ANV83500.1 hypothetical protein AWQ21_03355 [Picosynechococcus sp. PCC 7003]